MQLQKVVLSRQFKVEIPQTLQKHPFLGALRILKSGFRLINCYIFIKIEPKITLRLGFRQIFSHDRFTGFFLVIGAFSTTAPKKSITNTYFDGEKKIGGNILVGKFWWKYFNEKILVVKS